MYVCMYVCVYIYIYIYVSSELHQQLSFDQPHSAFFMFALYDIIALSTEKEKQQDNQ